MQTPVTLPPALPSSKAPSRESERVFYCLLMASVVAAFYLLFHQIALFSASLDAITANIPSDAFIAGSRVGAAIVILLLAKDLFVTLIAFPHLAALSHGLPEPRTTPYPLVSVIVPAYNESAAIEDTLASLTAIDYPALEVIVVDDGSTDDTLAKSRRVAAQCKHVPVRVFTQANCGKWSALNKGIRQASGAFVLCVDGDSMIKADALKFMVPHFDEPSVGAVSGQVQVRNQVNLITRLQAYEYIVANGGPRMAQSDSGCVLIVPGPVGLFRRSTLDEVSNHFAEAAAREDGSPEGPFSPHTYAEDFELSVLISATGQRVVYEPRAIALTNVPEHTSSLLSQRYRWLRGAMQVGSRYRREQWGEKSGNRPFRAWMNVVTLGDLYLLPLAGLLLLGTMLWALMRGNGTDFLHLWAIVWTIQMLTALMFLRSHNERLSLAFLAPLQGIYSVVLIAGVWLHAVTDQMASRPMRW